MPKEKEADSREIFLSPDELLKAFEGYPEFVKNAENILSGCTYSILPQEPKNLKTYKSEEKDEVILRELKVQFCLFVFLSVSKTVNKLNSRRNGLSSSWEVTC